MLIPFPTLVKKYGIKPKGVLHLGANEGNEIDWYVDNGVQYVVFVEAIPSVFEKLKLNMAYWSNTKVIIHCMNACVSDVDGNEVDFNISSNKGESSSFLPFGVHKSLHPDVSFVDTIKLTTRRLDTLVNAKGQEDFGMLEEELDFLNVDLQGAELLALKGMGHMLTHFKWAYIEVNRMDTYVGCPMVEEVDYYMLQFGFHRIETSQWIGGAWADAFYSKANMFV